MTTITELANELRHEHNQSIHETTITIYEFICEYAIALGIQNPDNNTALGPEIEENIRYAYENACFSPEIEERIPHTYKFSTEISQDNND